MNYHWLQTDVRLYTQNPKDSFILEKSTTNAVPIKNHYQTDIRKFVKTNKKRKKKNAVDILTREIHTKEKHIPPPPPTRCPLSPPPLYYLK